MATTADLRIGAVIKFNNDLCQVLESEHRTPGNLRAFYQVKMRNLRNNKLLENRFRSGETIEFVRTDRQKYQYLYRDGEQYVFMNMDNYEQIPVDAATLGDVAKFMKENQEVEIVIEETGGSIIAVELPTTVQLRVVQTEPGIRGDTANNVQKPATLETGAVVNVQIFVNEGDLVKIDTRTGQYMERVKE
jgi:elongation factor P